MEIYSYECSHCGFAIASSLSGGMYAVDNEGTRVPCLHPGEFSTAAEVLGISGEELGATLARLRATSGNPGSPQGTERELWLDELVSTRLKFTVGCCCFACCSRMEADSPLNERACPACGSRSLHTPMKSLGQECPKCHNGTIQKVGTGISI
jgi:ssDNA-binding Zn-finger/Zn-ribbon topoisomerase 1